MPSFGKVSTARLETCHPTLQMLMQEVVKFRDCSILYGHRDQPEQDKAFAEGHSGCKFPTSPHNKTPSMAVDAVPYPVPDWKDIPAFEDFGQFVLAVAKRLGIKIIWGRDFLVRGKPLRDYPHFELMTGGTNDTGSGHAQP